MKKIITTLLFGFMILGFSNAQVVTNTKTSSTSRTTTKTTAVATVNIYNPKTIKISEGEYSISFDLFNRVGIQSNIRYGVKLINVETSKVVDTNLSNESLTLKERETKNIVIDYKIPGFVPNGNYSLVIVAENQNGLPLAYVPANLSKDSIINVDGSSQSISIEKCTLTIFNDASSTAKYTNTQGVDIMPNEKLIATCDVINRGSSSENNVRFQLITHKKDNFGDIVSNDTLSDVVSIKAKSTQTVSFTIPTLQNSQLYFIDTFFVNSNGQKVSPSYPIYYSIHGYRATINNMILNASSYKKGAVADLNVFWTINGSGLRISANKDTYVIKAEIKDSSKNICGSTAKTTNNTSSSLNKTLFNIAITKNCNPAIATVSIFNAKGELLDSTEINSQSSVSKISINANIPSISNLSMLFNKTYRNYAVVFIAVLVLIGYGIVVLRKKEQENNK